MKNSARTRLTVLLIAALCVVGVLISVIVALLAHVQLLSSQVSVLKTETEAASLQLDAYDRSLCDTSYSITNQKTLTKYSIDNAGQVRTYQVHTPANYDPSVRYPVIISFDGIDGSGSRMESYAGLDVLPVITVYPDSLPSKRGFTAWQGAPYSLDGEYDIGFVKKILETLPSQYCVDATQIFAVGMSNGGAFATIVGCEMGNQIRAVASVSGAYYTTCNQEQRTPSLLLFHSTSDRQVPFSGSGNGHLPQISRWAEKQATERDCQTSNPSTTKNSVKYYNWFDCNDNSMLRLVVLKGQAHGWLTLPQVSGPNAQSTAGYIWEFFQDAAYRD